ncbi:zinc-binding dehydrogenase [Yersinia enterocolitica]|nr:zinc-binding dehydrogenase [Yersinia enterocolitica]HDM8329167.1 zinc-binding dehydrogenase [Yersinia enterocolitica]HDM8368182.1 zinc-binding dehydrogenase [Yersinia enterocolitica]
MKKSMQAIVMTAVGGPEVLELKSVPRPEIEDPHHILVRVMAAGVNPADLRVRKRMPPQTDWEMPANGIILGLEGAGIVEAIGAEVSRFGVGDEVYYFDGGFPGSQGNYAQFKVVNEHYVARKPGKLSFAQAAALPVVAITGWEALQDRASLAAGEYLLVQGGAGGLGHIGIQLGKLFGAHVAATVSTDAKAEVALRAGADHLILYRQEDVGAAVRSWTGKDGVNVIYDTVGDAVFSQSVDLLALHGRLVSAAYPTSWPKGDIFIPSIKNIHIAFEAMGHALGDHEQRIVQTRILEAVAKHVEDGDLTVFLSRMYPLAEAGEAHSALEEGEIMGRLALEIPHND